MRLGSTLQTSHTAQMCGHVHFLMPESACFAMLVRCERPLLDGPVYSGLFICLTASGGSKRRIVFDTTLGKGPPARLCSHQQKFYIAPCNAITHSRNMEAIS